MNKKHLYFVTTLLLVLGSAMFIYKAFVLEFPLVPHTQSNVWLVEASVAFNGRNKPTKASIFIPRNTPEFIIVDENFISRGYGLTSQVEEGSRKALWSIRRALGPQSLYYRAVIRQRAEQPKPVRYKTPRVEPVEFFGAKLEAINAILTEARAKSADSDSLTRAVIRILNRDKTNENVHLLVGKKPTAQKKSFIAAQIILRANIPGRTSHGIILEDNFNANSIIHRVEAFYDGGWHSYDPKTGNESTPENYIPWWYGEDSLADVKGGDRMHYNIVVNSFEEEAIVSAIERGQITNPILLEYSLFSLPLEAQKVYHVLLLIPIGAFIVVILRNVIGLKTFGTFMPVLIALAFRETALMWGCILFSLLVSAGLVVRFYLDKLKLLLVPRLAAILTVVVLMMAFLSILGNKLNFAHGLSLALFPMVIITMTIERMSIVWDELGSTEAIKQAAGSLLVAGIIYTCITLQNLQHLIFVFPELLLLVLAAIIYLGKYTGYKLFELGRFKELTRTK